MASRLSLGDWGSRVQISALRPPKSLENKELFPPAANCGSGTKPEQIGQKSRNGCKESRKKSRNFPGRSRRVPRTPGSKPDGPGNRHSGSPMRSSAQGFPNLGTRSEIALAFLVMSIEGCNEAAARILQEAREKTGRNQTQIANPLGRGQPWLSRIETRKRGLTVGEFLAIADELGLDWIEAIREVRKAL